MRNKLFLAILFLILGLSLQAQGQTSPQGISLQGRIVDASNNPLEDASVTFTVQIYSPGAEQCELYRESHTLNMSGSGGVFSLPVGSGTRAGAGFENTSTLAQVFNNASATINSLTCSVGTSYAPSSGAKRKIKMTFDNGGGPQVVTQTLDIQAVPYALYADTLQGKGLSDFLQTSAMTTQVKVDNLTTTANYNELLALIAGTSANYTLANGGNFTPAADVDFNGKKIVDLAAPTNATDAVNKDYSDTRFGGATLDQTGLANGQSIRWNSAGSKWEVYTPSTSDGTKLPLAGGTMQGAIDMGGYNLLATGHITMSSQKTIHLGSYTNAQETTLVGALAAIDEGKTWYNSETNQIKYWNGASPAVVVLNSSDIGTAAGKIMGADAVPNCLSTQKLQMSAGPVYSWSCVTDVGSQWITATNDIYFNTGTVGIGTTSPAFPLHVAKAVDGAAQIITIDNTQANSAASTNETAEIQFNFAGLRAGKIGAWKDNDFTSAANQDGGLRLFTEVNGSPFQAVTINPNGTIGMGSITTPLSMLHIGREVITAELRLDSTGYNPSPGDEIGSLTFHANEVGAVTRQYSSIYAKALDSTAGSVDGTLEFRTMVNGTSAPRMTIGAGGNVGIGTISPQAALDVANNGVQLGVSNFYANAQFTNSTASKGVVLGYDSTGTTGIVGGNTSGAASNLAFYTWTGSLWTEKMRVTDAGNVGVGTATPAAKLDVVDTGTTTSAIIFPRAGNFTGTAVNGMMRYNSTANKFEAYENGVWTNVIGTASTVSANVGTSLAPSITFSADSDTGFYSPAANTIGVAVGGGNIFNINSTAMSSTTTGGGVMTSINGTAAAPTFSFTGDEDTGWYRPGADSMAASTGGVERMKISNLGIVSVGDTGTSKTIDFSIIGGGGAIGTSSTWPMFLYPGNTLSVGLYNNRGVSIGASYASNTPPNDGLMVEGNVGIGTTSPLGKLDVVAPSNTRLLFNTDHLDISADADTGGWARAFRVTNGNNTNGQDGGAFGVVGTGVTPNYAFMAIPTADSTGYNSTKIISLNNSGNVGIGTTASTHALEIHKSDPADGYLAVLKNPATGAGTGAWLKFESSNASNENWGIGVDSFGWNIFNSTDGVARLTVNNAGNVGIGTTSPTTGTRLDITGTGAAASSIIIPRDTVANRPTVGVNGMIRYASDTNKFEAFENGAWTNIIGTASSLSAGNGTVGSPSMSFSGDPNTGLFSNGADVIGISSGGTNVFNISSTSLSSSTAGGALITTGNGTAASPTFSFTGDEDTGWFRPAADTLAASTAGSERMRIDSSGNVGIGTTTPDNNLEVTAAAATAPILMVTGYGLNATNVPQIYGRAARGTEASPTAVQTGDRLVSFRAYGYDGTDWSSLSMGATSAIEMDAAETFTGSARGSYMKFETTPIGSVTRSERMRIDPSGNVGIGTIVPSSILNIAGAGGTVLTIDNFSGAGGNSPKINGRAARGTSSVPTAVQSGDVLTQLTGYGYGATGYSSAASAAVVLFAQENWTDAAQGSQIEFWTTATGQTAANKASRMTISPTGNVGIGTTGPNEQLHVYKNANSFLNFKIENASAAGDQADTTINMKTRSSNYSFHVNDETNNFALLDGNASGAIRMLVDSSGNVGLGGGITWPTFANATIYAGASGSVGIGTTSPSNNLDVSKSQNGQTTIAVNNTNAGASAAANFLAVTNAGSVGFGMNSTANGSGVAYLWNNANTDLAFATNSTEKMRVTAIGDVGIGTIGPAQALHVVRDNTQSRIRLESTGASNGSAGVEIKTTDGGQWNIWMDDDSNDDLGEGDRMAFSYGASHRMILDGSSGNVGLGGQTNPAYTLDVTGDIRITGTPYRTGGDIAWQVPSDARLKNILGDYEYGLNEILQIHTVRYNYIENNAVGADPSKKYVGVLAQEVQKVIPDAVRMEGNGYLSLNTTPITWATINAIKDLNTKCEMSSAQQESLNKQIANRLALVEREVASLKKENEDLKSRLEKLERLVLKK